MPNVRSVLLAIAIVALLGSPFAAAGWSAFGNHEPDTPADVADGQMFVSPHTDGDLAPVYFNGYFSSNDLNAASPSPNAGTVGSSISSQRGQTQALLGVWIDCDRDGFIGMGDQGLLEYRVELLSADAAARGYTIPDQCAPVRAMPSSNAGLARWHNDGTWVREFIPISWTQGCDDRPGCVVPPDWNPLDINDNDARVWVDAGFPEDVPAGQCAANPPSGSLHSTGAFLAWNDCNTHGAIGDDVTLVANTAGQPSLGFGDVDDHDYGDSSSTLNMANPWGSEGSDSYADVWDCSNDPTPVTRDPTANDDPGSGELHHVAVDDPTTGDEAAAAALTSDDGYVGENLVGTSVSTGIVGVINVHTYVNASDPDASPTTHLPPARAPRMGDPSPAGTANSMLSGADRCERRTAAGPSDRSTAETVAHAPYAAEQDIGAQGVSDAKKTTAMTVLHSGYNGVSDTTIDGVSTTFGIAPIFGVGAVKLSGRASQFEDASFNVVTVPFLGPVGPDHGAGTTVASTLGENAPLELGTSAATSIPSWHDDLTALLNTQRTFTWYGLVSPGTITSYGLTVVGAIASYGSDHCAGEDEIDGTWSCRADAWWRGADDIDASWRAPYLGRDASASPTDACTTLLAVNTDATTRGCVEVSPYPGSPYNLKDQDCYDNGVSAARGSGVPTTTIPDATGQGELTIGPCPSA